MPTEGETRPCSYPCCKGTLTYRAHAKSPVWGADKAGDRGQIVWGGQEKPGWECDADREHFKPARPN